jgi:hypothetical protein
MDTATFQRLTPTVPQIAAIEKMRYAFADLVSTVEQHVPEGPDRTYIIRQLRTCAMWANMSITHNADGSPRV